MRGTEARSVCLFRSFNSIRISIRFFVWPTDPAFRDTTWPRMLVYMPLNPSCTHTCMQTSLGPPSSSSSPSSTKLHLRSVEANPPGGIDPFLWRWLFPLLWFVSVLNAPLRAWVLVCFPVHSRWFSSFLTIMCIINYWTHSWLRLSDLPLTRPQITSSVMIWLSLLSF